jgi:ribosomal RNA-processing protein 9
LDELAYIETLFGHQDEVTHIAALAQERCISVGARDRTARLWKVVEETQLVFRGGGGEKKSKNSLEEKRYADGSMDRVAMIDEEMFVTGSDNGSISLWALQKKKPIFTISTAHGFDTPMSADAVSAEQNPDPEVIPESQPRWITALATIPYSDVVLSGSWDGCIRVWRVSEDKKRLESVGVIGELANLNANLNANLSENGTKQLLCNGNSQSNEPDTSTLPEDNKASIRGVVNDISVIERGNRSNDGVCIVAAVGSEHRLGRWMKHKARNGAVVFEVKNTKRDILDNVDAM